MQKNYHKIVCEAKKVYETYSEAEKAAKGRNRGRKYKNVYKCRVCNKFHLTTEKR